MSRVAQFPGITELLQQVLDATIKYLGAVSRTDPERGKWKRRTERIQGGKKGVGATPMILTATLLCPVTRPHKVHGGGAVS